jgi:hypothetical protein
MEKTERQEAEKLALPPQAWKEGVDSGAAGEIDSTALKNDARARRSVMRDPDPFFGPRAKRRSPLL